MEYLRHVSQDSARFGEVLAGLDPSTPVPSCPGWDVAELLWHLTEVQAHWRTIVEQRAAEPLRPDVRRADRHERAIGQFVEESARLVDCLAEATPDTQVWTWHEPDQSVGFVLRRQAHEAVIHRADAELAAGIVPAIERELASDGVDEILRVMMSTIPGWATFTPGREIYEVEATDTGGRWLLQSGVLDGTSPSSGTTYESLDAFVIVTDGLAEAAVAGSAEDLDLWLWGRGSGEQIGGSSQLKARLRADAIESTQ